MRKFRFRFESVESVRQRRENETLGNLASAQRVLQAELSRKTELLSALEGALLTRERLGVDAPADYASYHIVESFVRGTQVRLAHQDAAILRANRKVQKAMAAYLAARRDRRMIEVLRERDLAQFKADLRKREQRRDDDLAIMRARFRGEVGI